MNEAELITEETALYLGDINLNFRRGILLPRNNKREFIRSILKLIIEIYTRQYYDSNIRN